MTANEMIDQSLNNISAPSLTEDSLLKAIDQGFDFKGGTWQLTSLPEEQEIPVWNYLDKREIVIIADCNYETYAKAQDACKDTVEYTRIVNDNSNDLSSMRVIAHYWNQDEVQCEIRYSQKSAVSAVNKETIDFDGITFDERNEYFFVLNDAKNEWIKVDFDDATYGFLYNRLHEWTSVQDSKNIIFSGSVIGTNAGEEDFDLSMKISNIAMDDRYANELVDDNLNYNDDAVVYVPVVRVEISDHLHDFNYEF